MKFDDIFLICIFFSDPRCRVCGAKMKVWLPRWSSRSRPPIQLLYTSRKRCQICSTVWTALLFTISWRINSLGLKGNNRYNIWFIISIINYWFGYLKRSWIYMANKKLEIMQIYLSGTAILLRPSFYNDKNQVWKLLVFADPLKNFWTFWVSSLSVPRILARPCVYKQKKIVIYISFIESSGHWTWAGHAPPVPSIE